MIIKSHVRGGHRAAADYLKSVGKNERIRLVEISDPDAKDLDEAFRNMWAIGKTTRAQKPLHHVSINPFKDERLTDAQVRQICERLEKKFGYKPGEHQRVIVEHIKDGRQHFHVMWNRVSLTTGRPVWPGHHWNKSKQVAREMEIELGLKRPEPRRRKKLRRHLARRNKQPRRLQAGKRTTQPALVSTLRTVAREFKAAQRSVAIPMRAARPMCVASIPRRFSIFAPKHPPNATPVEPTPMPVLTERHGMSVEELIAWAWENRRSDILARFGIYVSFGL